MEKEVKINYKTSVKKPKDSNETSQGENMSWKELN